MLYRSEKRVCDYRCLDVLPILRVFLQGSGALRDLPSFPTRRSSDLNHSTFCDLVIAGLVGVRPQGAWGIEIDPLLDRKSTRLNSSHQIISYAVFCLKKKKHASSSLAASSPEVSVCRIAPSPLQCSRV